MIWKSADLRHQTPGFAQSVGKPFPPRRPALSSTFSTVRSAEAQKTLILRELHAFASLPASSVRLASLMLHHVRLTILWKPSRYNPLAPRFPTFPPHRPPPELLRAASHSPRLLAAPFRECPGRPRTAPRILPKRLQGQRVPPTSQVPPPWQESFLIAWLAILFQAHRSSP